jgi:hypothetical protein
VREYAQTPSHRRRLRFSDSKSESLAVVNPIFGSAAF